MLSNQLKCKDGHVDDVMDGYGGFEFDAEGAHRPLCATEKPKR